jgi:protein TonB
MATEAGISGTLYLSFTVEKDGSVTDAKVERKVGYGMDEEAIRVLRASKRWNPGMQNGKPVRVKYNIPIKFNLQQ